MFSGFDLLYNKFLIILHYLIAVGWAGYGEWTRANQLAPGVGWSTGGRRADGWSRRRGTGRGPDPFRAVHRRLTSGWHGSESSFVSLLCSWFQKFDMDFWFDVSEYFWQECWLVFANIFLFDLISVCSSTCIWFINFLFRLLMIRGGACNRIYLFQVSWIIFLIVFIS